MIQWKHVMLETPFSVLLSSKPSGKCSTNNYKNGMNNYKYGRMISGCRLILAGTMIAHRLTICHVMTNVINIVSQQFR